MKLHTLLSLGVTIAAAVTPYAMADFRTTDRHSQHESRANERSSRDQGARTQNNRDQNYRNQSNRDQSNRDQSNRDQSNRDQSNRNTNTQWQTNALRQRDDRERQNRNDRAHDQNQRQSYTIKPTAFKPLKPHVIGSQHYRPSEHSYHHSVHQQHRYPVTSVQYRHWNTFDHHHHATYHSHYYHGARYDAAYLLGGIVLGVLLSERTPLEGYYYSDGYRDYDYINVRSDTCYESFYRDGRRMLIEVDRYYCR
jgi:hypothetical protein